MKKLQLLFLAFLVSLTGVQAQFAEDGPYSEAPQSNSQEALFDLQFNFDVGVNGSIGAQSQAGVAYINDEFWVSTWNDNTIHILDSGGNHLNTIVIAGITGTRSMTTDGTNVYIGTAGTEIFVVDPVAMTLSSTINVNTGSDAEARMCTYDPTLDGGAGGFWIGDFGSAIASVDMNGDELSVIDAATHGTAIYGGAVDNITAGGPYLWIHDQSGTAPNRDFITQLQLPGGAPTGLVYDYTGDAPGGNTEVLAGGLFITDTFDPAMHMFIGLCQCSPSNIVFGLELEPILGVDNNDISNFSISPNPANEMISIETGVEGEMQVVIFDILGKQVVNTIMEKAELNISALNAGVYMVQVTQNNNTAVKKLIVR